MKQLIPRDRRRMRRVTGLLVAGSVAALTVAVTVDAAPANGATGHTVSHASTTHVTYSSRALPNAGTPTSTGYI